MERPFPAYKGDKPFIFVSYSHQDAELVYPELTYLKDQGFNVWYDEGISPGASWREELAESILNSSLFIIYVSPRSVESDNCVKEVSYALEHGASVLAVHLEKTQLTPGQELGLSDRQAILKYELSQQDYLAKLVNGISDYVNKPETTTQVVSAPSLEGESSKVMLMGFGLVALAILGSAFLLRSGKDLAPSAPVAPLTDSETSGIETQAKVRSNWIAVLPFTTLSGNSEMELLAQGTTTQMIHALAPIPDFSIVPYRTVERFSDRTMSLDEIAKALNVRYLLDGRIQQSGDKIRIGVELIDGIRGISQWQESKTFTAGDMLAIQDEVTLLTVRILSARMDGIEMQRLATLPKEAMSADELAQGASNFWFDPNQANLDLAIGDLKRALQLDPNHVGSLGQLAHFIELNILMGGEKDAGKALIVACELADRAVALGGDVVSASGALYAITEICGDAARAVQIAEQGLSSNRENATVWAVYSYHLLNNRDIQQALVALDKAEELDKDGIWVKYLVNPFRALAHIHNGDWNQGVKFAQKAVNVGPGQFWLEVYLANALGMTGDYKGARDRWQLIKDRFPGLTVERCHWYFRRFNSEEKANLFVEGLIRAQVES